MSKKKPTIAEIEALMKQHGEGNVTLHPDGQVTVGMTATDGPRVSEQKERYTSTDGSYGLWVRDESDNSYISIQSAVVRLNRQDAALCDKRQQIEQLEAKNSELEREVGRLRKESNGLAARIIVWSENDKALRETARCALDAIEEDVGSLDFEPILRGCGILLNALAGKDAGE